MSFPKLNKPAPAFKTTALMPDGSEKVLSLSDYKGKWVVLFFYPLDFTFVCPTEIISFSEAAAEFQKSNCEVIGASIDSYYSHLAWTQQDRKKGGLGKMNIPLLADVNRRCSEAYGCLMEEDGHTCRATYIIDPQGNLRHFAMNDPPVGRNVEDVLRLVQGYKHADEHPGFVCPMNWKPGHKTIKVADKEEFFGAAEAN